MVLYLQDKYKSQFIVRGGGAWNLSIQERLKDLRVEQTNLFKSMLGSYEADESKDISHYALIKLVKSADYLLGLTETKNHPNTDLADLRLDDDMIELLKSVPEDNPLKGFLQAADETASENGNPEQAPFAFICKWIRLNYEKLSGRGQAPVSWSGV